MRAYDEVLLKRAQESLGRMLDYSVHSLRMDADAMMGLLIATGVGRQFGHGDTRLICGMSGIELAFEVMERSGLAYERVTPRHTTGLSNEYWCGYALAYTQWVSGMEFDEIILGTGFMAQGQSRVVGTNNAAFTGAGLRNAGAGTYDAGSRNAGAGTYDTGLRSVGAGTYDTGSRSAATGTYDTGLRSVGAGVSSAGSRNAGAGVYSAGVPGGSRAGTGRDNAGRDGAGRNGAGWDDAWSRGVDAGAAGLCARGFRCSEFIEEFGRRRTRMLESLPLDVSSEERARKLRALGEGIAFEICERLVAAVAGCGDASGHGPQRDCAAAGRGDPPGHGTRRDCDAASNKVAGFSTRCSLKRMRMLNGLSQSQLAEASGIPVRTIQQYEQGQKNLSKARAEYIIALARVLNCEPARLLN